MNSASEPSRPGGCSESERVAQFVKGLLPESDAASVAAHTDACPDCQQVLAEFDQEQDGLVAWLQRASQTPRMEPPDAREEGRAVDETEMLTALPGTGRAEASASDSKASDSNMSRLIRRLEQLPHQRPAERPDWNEWARDTLEFGPDGPPGFPQYRLESVLGAGGMGVVLGVFDTSLNRAVALKVLRPELAGDVAMRERFLSEARAMAALRHDQIVRVFQTGTLSAGALGSLPFLTMERFNGETLAQRLTRGPALTLGESLQVARDIARALTEAHRNGMVHRDVKPENVFLDGTVDRFQVKLLDFGLARDVSKADLDDEHGWVLGTPAYMAPEQARGETATEQSDLFSLGCVMYRLLSGRLPFDGETPQEMLRARLQQSPVALQTLVPALPRELTASVDGLLSGDAERRPLSSTEVARRLERLAEVHRGKAPRPMLSRAMALAGLAVFIVAVAIAVGNYFGHSSREADKAPDTGSLAFSAAPGLTSLDRKSDSGEQSLERADSSPETADSVHSPTPLPIEPLDADWLTRVSMLAPDAQVAEVVAELKRRNPDWSGQFEFDLQGLAINRFRMFPPGLRDVAPVRAFPNLKHLQFPGGEEGGEVTDLTPLKGMFLIILDCGNNPIADFGPLRGMPLSILRAKSTRVSDLSPLSELPLRVLQLAETPVEDLAPIKDCPLWLLSFWGTSVRDLSPLAGLTTLTRLECERTLVTDLSPLSGLKLKHLACQESPIEDYSVLAEFPLEELHITFDRSIHRDLLRSIPTLKKINYRPAGGFLK